MPMLRVLGWFIRMRPFRQVFHRNVRVRVVGRTLIIPAFLLRRAESAVTLVQHSFVFFVSFGG